MQPSAATIFSRMNPALPPSPAAARRPLLVTRSLIVFGAAESVWTPSSVGSGLAAMAVFTIAGVLLALVGYKLFDRFTAGDLHREIMEHKNVAAAILAAAVVLGICIIVSAAMIG